MRIFGTHCLNFHLQRLLLSEAGQFAHLHVRRKGNWAEKRGCHFPVLERKICPLSAVRESQAVMFVVSLVPLANPMEKRDGQWRGVN